MKTLFFFCLSVLSTLSVTAQRYLADVQQSKLNWTGHAELGSYAPMGTIQLRQGMVELRNGQINQTQIGIDMRTIQHENGQMQAHLRGEDFFDTTQFPTASFELQQISGGQASGRLTIKGVTKPVTFPVVMTLAGDELRLQGQVVIDRTVFGIKYNSGSFFAGLGDQAIRNTFELAFTVVARRNSAVGKQ